MRKKCDTRCKHYQECFKEDGGKEKSKKVKKVKNLIGRYLTKLGFGNFLTKFSKK